VTEDQPQEYFQTVQTPIERLIREPLLHFLLLGAMLFVTYQYVAGEQDATPADNQIIVPAGKAEHLAALLTRTENQCCPQGTQAISWLERGNRVHPGQINRRRRRDIVKQMLHEP
jgi:hypothetical protein